MVKVVRLNWPRRRALSGSCDGTLKLWDLDAESSCIRSLHGHQDEVWSADVDWARSRALSGSADCTLRYWSLQSGDCMATLHGHTSGVSAVSLGKGGRAASSSWDRTLRLWDLEKQECLTILMHGSSVTTMSVDWEHGKALCGSPQAMKLWDFNRQTCEHSLAGHLCDSIEVSGSSTPVSVGHNECVTSLVMNSPDYLYPEADA
ncbi:FBXW7 [Symbiodinium natans]|uniref:FBXW7 protein n=1 Tax=Symbiodinium natans TaxID=878477 RepID=A0A812PCJ6_9DINO|nr:FBXW7 [Symbiodinium natans]